jgi:hypothetical protein
MTYEPTKQEAVEMIQILLNLADCLEAQVTLIQSGWLDAEKRDIASTYRAIRNYQNERDLKQAIQAGYAKVEEWSVFAKMIEIRKIQGETPKAMRKGRGK